MSQHGDNESKSQLESVGSFDPAQDSMPQIDTAVCLETKEMEAIQSVSDDEGDVESGASPQGSSSTSDGDDDEDEYEDENEEGEASDNACDHDRESVSTENADDLRGDEMHVTEESQEVKQLDIGPVLSTLSYPALQLREQAIEEQSNRPKIEKLDRPGTKRAITPPIKKEEKFFVQPNIQHNKPSRSTSGRITWKELDNGERVRVIHAPVTAVSASPAPAPVQASEHPKINKIDEHEKNVRVATAAVPSLAVPALHKKQKKAKAVPVPTAQIEAPSAIHKKQKKDKAIPNPIPQLEAPPAAALPLRRRKARASGGSDSKKVKEILEREKRRRDAAAVAEESVDHIQKEVAGLGSFAATIEAIQRSFKKLLDGPWEKLFAKGDRRGRHRGLRYQYNWAQKVLTVLALFVVVSQMIILLG